MIDQEIREAVGTYDKMFDTKKKTFKNKFHIKDCFKNKNIVKSISRC
jgi:hypothetical protein